MSKKNRLGSGVRPKFRIASSFQREELNIFWAAEVINRSSPPNPTCKLLERVNKDEKACFETGHWHPREYSDTILVRASGVRVM